jgi:hypothetical protein
VGVFGRRTKRVPGVAPAGRRGIDEGDHAHLEAFLVSRRGVEAYLEPATTVTPYTVVLVAHDGEWTRRPCREPEDGAAFAKRHNLPFYDVRATGYPPRMRAWSAARKAAGGDGQPAAVRRRPDDHEMPPDPFA